MPLFRSIEIFNSSKIGLWRITEAEEELFDIIRQRTFDIDQLRVFHNDLKKKQWLASRCLITHMDEGIGRIIYDELGAPYCDNEMKISLSHSDNMVAVILDPVEEVGIDIQHFTKKIDRIKAKFCSEEELKYVEGQDSLQLLHVIWSAKEALYKKLKIPGLIFKENLQIPEFQLSDRGELHAHTILEGEKSVEVLRYEIIEDYTMVFTSNT